MSLLKNLFHQRCMEALADDNGYSDITADDYNKIRIGDQINYYKKRIVQLDQRLRIFQWLIYITGGVGTFLAAVGFELWVALSIALVALFTTFLEYRQIQNTVMQYNQAVTNLVNLQNWWIALPVDEKKKQQNIDKLVDSSETILNSELTGWVQQMQSTMENLCNSLLYLHFSVHFAIIIIIIISTVILFCFLYHKDIEKVVGLMLHSLYAN